MSLEQYREAVLGEAREAAERVTSEAQRAAEAARADCEREARSIIEDASASGTEAASQELVVRERLARRQARERVQEAKRAVYEQLRARALDVAEASRGSDEYRALLADLRELACAQIGPEAALTEDPEGAGGLLAEGDGRRVSYTLPDLIDQTLQELGSDVERLWA